MSRGGILIVHSQELFPAEQMTMVLPDFKTRFIEVTRCRRIQDCCYEVGAVFVSSLRA